MHNAHSRCLEEVYVRSELKTRMNPPDVGLELHELPPDAPYAPLISAPVPEDLAMHLEGTESFELEAISNLDVFFTQVYRYYVEKGYAVLVVSRLLNVLALVFSIGFSWTLLLAVNWNALHSPCIIERKCDILEVAFYPSPLTAHSLCWTSIVLMYLSLLTLYLGWCFVHMVEDVFAASEMRNFYLNRLGISDRSLATMSWPEVLRRVVLLQQHTRLCLVRDLTAHDICARIMRRDNYLIGMLNKGVLALNAPIPGLRQRVMLTKVIEWNLRYCLLDAMFDKNFLIKQDFKRNPEALARRFRRMAMLNLLLLPFLLVFLIIYFFMRNAEKFYHHPSSVAARSWSPYARWRLRELNEVEHLLRHRLAGSRAAAAEYIAQFPTPVLRQVAKFTAFISGSFAALVLFLAAVNDVLMERHLAGHNLVWWGACLGVLLAISRSLIGEDTPVFLPEAKMAKVAKFTHYLPRHWRGRANTCEVQEQFEGLFCFKALLFLEELASVLLAPIVLGFSLPKCSEAITRFILENSVNVTGLGDVCSLAQFDMTRHGSRRYGSPHDARRGQRSRQGKLEKSLVSFASTYEFWEPEDVHQKALLDRLGVTLPPMGPHPVNIQDSCEVGWSQMMSFNQPIAESGTSAYAGAASACVLSAQPGITFGVPEPLTSQSISNLQERHRGVQHTGILLLGPSTDRAVTSHDALQRLYDSADSGQI